MHTLAILSNNNKKHYTYYCGFYDHDSKTYNNGYNQYKMLKLKIADCKKVENKIKK